MGANNGHTNEYEICDALNGKRVNQLPKHFSSWLTKLGFASEEIVNVKKLNNEQKADICIKSATITKYISIKSGGSNSFHSEPINVFIPFLRSLGISENTLKTIVLYHYGDNTYDGTGPTRFTSAELRRVYPGKFKQASDELSQTSIIKAIISRCITKGRFPTNYVIDGIYHGTVEQGLFVPTKAIYQILLRKKYRRKNGTINIGMLTYQPGSRNLWGIPGSEQKRSQSEIKWRSFAYDITDYEKNADRS
jgi:hypothetical protein